jgi:hypothetical protein
MVCRPGPVGYCRHRLPLDRRQALGGSQYGRTTKKNAEKATVVLDLARQGKSNASISRTDGLSRQWVYELIRRSESIGR